MVLGLSTFLAFEPLCELSLFIGGNFFLAVCGFLDSSTILNISFLKEENSFWIAGVTLSGLFNNKEV